MPKFTDYSSSVELSSNLPLILVEHAYDPIVKIDPFSFHPFFKKYHELNPKALIIFEPKKSSKSDFKTRSRFFGSDSDESFPKVPMYLIDRIRQNNRLRLSNASKDIEHRAYIGCNIREKVATYSDNLSQYLPVRMKWHFMNTYILALQTWIDVDKKSVGVFAV